MLHDIETTCAIIRSDHRAARFAMKARMKVEQSFSSYVLVNQTHWSPNDDDNLQAEQRKRRDALIAAAKKCVTIKRKPGTPLVQDFIIEKPADEAVRAIVDLCAGTMVSVQPFIAMQAERERKMEKLVKQLPIAAWIDTVPGVSCGGVAQIIGECGNLSNYATERKLWKRLGFAPYDGLAMSSWKRETWRPRTLSSAEWIDNPFKGERYAIMAQIAQWLWVKQWTGAAKTEDGQGAPNGTYGQVYFDRRQATALSHEDWTKGHSHADALRVMMKRFLADLWQEWRSKDHVAEMPVAELAVTQFPLAAE